MKSFFKKILFGGEILSKVSSPINGEILVTENFFGNREMKVGGVTQSGGLVEKLWNKTLFIAQKSKIKDQNNLILGLGCGTVAKIISERWPGIKITGIEIDEKIVELGKKYFELDKIPNLKIIISDAFTVIRNSKFEIRNSKYSLIIVDLYLGQEFPVEAENESFLNSLKNILDKNGLIIFNRLNFGKHKQQTLLFKEKLIKVFPSIIGKKIDYNLLLFASLEAPKKV